MDPQKLFQVLVVGGALLGLGCMSEPEPGEDASVGLDSGPVSVDSGPVASDAGPAPADAGPDPGGDAGLMECGICPNEECCVTDESGTPHAREGFVCCWGTSC